MYKAYPPNGFCFHDCLRLRERGLGHRSCWGPHTAFRECHDCGATVEVRV